jgi:alkyl hydroperoxide reductase subunit F
MDKHDLIILGAGPAGITASIYAARKKLDFLVISKDIGGQVNWSGEVDNYTGYQLMAGSELISKFEEHMKKYNIPFRENETVKEVKRENNFIKVITDKGEYVAKAVIIATGKKSKELGLREEDRFKNKGLTYCATCDGPLFSNKEVAVIGGGNSALDAALQLMNIAKKVYIVNITDKLTGDKVMQDKLIKKDNVEIFNKSKVTAIKGELMVSGITINTPEGNKDLNVEGIFVEIGLIPNSTFIKEVEKNDIGEIKVSCNNKTNIKGIFAAGDVTDAPEKQIIVAAGEGAKAALGTFRYLMGEE